MQPNNIEPNNMESNLKNEVFQTILKNKNLIKLGF